MSTLNNDHKNLILDLYFGCAENERLNDARALIAANSDAAKLYSQIEESMEILDYLKEDDHKCPDHLVANTVNKLKEASERSQSRLEELLAHEQVKVATTSQSFWRRMFDVAAVAAMIVIVSGLYFPTVNNMRQKSWNTACQANMSGIATAVSNYARDNDGQLPAVYMPNNAPWWKVGYQGEENYSNTRHLWKLVQNKYVNPGAFVCQGRSDGRAVSLDNQNIEHLRDFPDRKYITYSFQLIKNRVPRIDTQSSMVLMSDSNPVFENLKRKESAGYDNIEFKTLKLCKRLERLNSRNHRRAGQNLMYSDGSVKFLTIRSIQLGGENESDDIFTVRGTMNYSGCEETKEHKDIFLVP